VLPVRGREGGNQAVAHGRNPRLGIGLGLLANRVFDEIHDPLHVIDGLPVKDALECRQLNVKDALPVHDCQRLPGPVARLHGRELVVRGEEEVIRD
jgi:hypothetical protein